MDRNEPIVVTKVVGSSAKTTWEALTNREQMVQWFFEEIEEFRPEVGFKTQFVINLEGATFTHRWEIVEVQEEKLITYDWRYDEYPGIGKVVFELTPQGEKTSVRVTNEGLGSFPEDRPEFTRESCHGGWNFFLDELATFLESRSNLSQ